MSDVKKNQSFQIDDPYHQGKCAFMAADYEKALQYFEKDIEKNPTRIDSFFHIGYCQSILGFWDKAVGWARDTIDPDLQVRNVAV